MQEFPAPLLASLQGLEGFDKDPFLKAHSDSSVISVRVNPRKSISVFDGCKKVPWCTNGFYLDNRPDFTADPLFHAGCYYVQDASSMFLEHALRNAIDLGSALKVLDLCAAPGGKSTLLASLISDNSILVSNEVIKTRVSVLEENLVKWGCKNVFLTSNDPKDLSRLESYFDVLVVDAPCSGSGLFRKDPGAIDEWSEKNVTLCSQRQQRILADALPALKGNGVLIYSTCSYSVQENEAVADWLAEEFDLETVRIPVEKDWGVVETCSERKCFGYRFFPDKARGEGFYLSVFRKKNSQGCHTGRKQENIKEASAGEHKVIQKWVRNPEEYFFVKDNKDEIIAVNKGQKDALAAFKSMLNLKKSGVRIGKIRKDELVPDHELAMSGLVPGGIVQCDLDRASALKYLKKENLSLAGFPRGWLLLFYENMPLGWAKNLGNRINNYYPKNWRILKAMEA